MRATSRSRKTSDVDALVASSNRDVRYRPGSYIRVMLTMLHTLALLSIVPLLTATNNLLLENDITWFLMATMALGLTAFVIWRMFKDGSQRAALESGLLSIHSCAILWQVVAMLHFKSISRLHDAGWRGYTYHLCLYAEDFKENIFHVYEYLEGRRSGELD